MQAEIAQKIALVLSGNAYLKGNEAFATDLEANNSSFQFDATHSYTLNGKVFDTWLEALTVLKAEGVHTFALVAREKEPATETEQEAEVSPVAEAAFVNGVALNIAAIADDHTTIWTSQMSVLNQYAQDDRVWQNDFVGESTDVTELPKADIGAVRAALIGLLDDVIELCTRNSVEFWTHSFTNARAQLDSEAPVPSYFADSLDALPDRLELRQLITTAYDSFVFGGTGSWNELHFDSDQPLYEDLTKRLYDAVIDALIAVITNSLRWRETEPKSEASEYEIVRSSDSP